MKLIKIKSVQIFSNGSLNLCNKNFTIFKQFNFHEKDHKNFFLNKKEKIIKIKSDYSSSYKNKYLISK
jgi:hypothetical protein